MPRKLFGTYIGSQMGGKFVVGAEFVIPALQKFVNNILHRAVPAGFLCLRPDVVNCQIRIFCVFSEPFSLLLIIFKDFMHRLNCKTVWSTDDGAEPFCRSYPRNAAELLHNFEKRRFSDTDVPQRKSPLPMSYFPAGSIIHHLKMSLYSGRSPSVMRNALVTVCPHVTNCRLSSFSLTALQTAVRGGVTFAGTA